METVAAQSWKNRGKIAVFVYEAEKARLSNCLNLARNCRWPPLRNPRFDRAGQKSSSFEKPVYLYLLKCAPIRQSQARFSTDFPSLRRLFLVTTLVTPTPPRSREKELSSFPADNKLSDRQLAYYLADILDRFQWPGSNPEKCRRARFQSNLDILKKKDGAVYEFGFIHCGQPWKCPICARQIARRRGKEIQSAIDKCRAAGGQVLLLTGTARHYNRDDLRALKKAVSKAFGRMTSGPPYVRAKKKFGILEYCRTIEVTHGQNGFHPHIHALIFLRQRLTDAQRAALEDFFAERWANIVEHDTDRRPSREHGLTLCDGSNAGNYIAKMTRQGLADELTRSDSKAGRNGSRSFLQVVYDFGEHGRASDEAIIREWFEAMPGTKWITYSRNFKKRYFLPEQSDFDLAQDEDDCQVEKIISIPGPVCDRLTRQGRHWIPALVEVARRSGRAGVTAFLDMLMENLPP